MQTSPECSIIFVIEKIIWSKIGLFQSRVGRYVKVSIEELSNTGHYFLPHAKRLSLVTVSLTEGWRWAEDRTGQCVSVHLTPK